MHKLQYQHILSLTWMTEPRSVLPLAHLISGFCTRMLPSCFCCYSSWFQLGQMWFFLPAREELREHEVQGVDRTRTAELNWSKGYSMLYDIVPKKEKKNRKKNQPWKMVGSWLGVGQWIVSNSLCITCFVYL